jgi:hypothetical protein
MEQTYDTAYTRQGDLGTKTWLRGAASQACQKIRPPNTWLTTMSFTK